GLQQRWRLGVAAGNAETSDDHQSRTWPGGAVSLVRSVRPGDRAANERVRPHPCRPLPPIAIPGGLFLCQLSGLLGGGIVRLLLAEAGELVYEAARGQIAAPALRRGLVALYRRFRTTQGSGFVGRAPRRYSSHPDEAGRGRDRCRARMDRD